MSTHINIASMVKTTLLRRILVLMRLVHCVAVGPFYDSFLPLTVMRNWWFSDLLRLMDTTIHPYVTLFPAGTADQ